MTDRPAIAVVGLGTMGLGIAQVFAGAGFPVLATDAQAAIRDSAHGRLGAALDALVAKGRMEAAQRKDLLDRITVTETTEGLSSASLAIEAIVERLEAKRDLFSALEQCLSPDAVLATNTSSLSVASIAEGLARPGRLLGLHFFNPAPLMRLVELVPHAGSERLAVEVARRLTEACGKTVIDAPDRPGFIVNRCARPFYGEALAMLDEGISARRIDAAMLAAGYRLGPFALIDLIGADVHLAATEGVWQAMDRNPRYLPFPALRAAVSRGDLGRKSGTGFVFPETVSPAADPRIVERIEAMLINEALWLLSEGGTTRDGIDSALRLGLNFPRGPFEILHETGNGQVARILTDLAAKAPASLAGRYAPAPGLK